jgi:hypothetical protein
MLPEQKKRRDRGLKIDVTEGEGKKAIVIER